MVSQCHTKYPIVFIHGLGFRDRKHLNYWGRIPKILINNGATIYYGNQDSHGSVQKNALQIKESIETILKDSGVQKVNLIAHSKGGLDARYMISALKMHEKVASLTTVSTPHHGSKTIDKILLLPKYLIKTVAFFSDLWYKILGDETPDSYNLFHQFSTSFLKDFNKTILDNDAIYYQSYAFIMQNMFSDFFLSIPYLIIKFFEGENDGLVTPSSAKWTNFKGIIKSSTNRGISHCDEVDMRRHGFSKIQLEDRVSDITNFYIDLVSDLKIRGL